MILAAADTKRNPAAQLIHLAVGGRSATVRGGLSVAKHPKLHARGGCTLHVTVSRVLPAHSGVGGRFAANWRRPHCRQQATESCNDDIKQEPTGTFGGRRKVCGQLAAARFFATVLQKLQRQSKREHTGAYGGRRKVCSESAAAAKCVTTKHPKLH